MEKTIIIKETKPDLGTEGWSFKLSDTDNEKTTLAKSATNEEDLVRWYLQDYPLEEPFDRDKAQQAKAYLANYSTLLYDNVSLVQIETCREINHVKILEHDAESSTFHSLHWELLEQSGDALLGHQSPLRISRTVECPLALSCDWKEDLVALKSSKTFNILLFVSRPEILTHGKNDVSHRLAVRPLFSILESFPDGLLSIEVARPGTWEGLKQHLEDAAVRGKFFHLVHLDVHGSTSISEKQPRTTKVTTRAKLHFLPGSFGAYGKVSAAQIARQLRMYKVLAVVLNACESARGDSGLQANLAKVFVAAGIPLVVAMSYKILDSAASIFMGQFYRSMFLDRLPFTACAAEGRRALRKDQRRVGRFGIPLDLVDWFVPVAYTSTNSEFEIEYLALVPSISDRVRSHPGIGQPEDVRSDIPSTWGERGPTSIECDPVNQPTFEADIFRAETLLLTSRKKILLIEEDLGVGKENFLEQAASWWRESGLVRSTVHIRWQDQETSSRSANLLHGTELRLFGERMGITRKSVKSIPEFLKTIAEFFLINAMLVEHHPKSRRSTWIANMIILDGIPLHLWAGTKAVLNPIIPTFVQKLVNLEAAVCVGSHADMRILASVLDDPPLMTLCGNSEQLFSKHGFQRLLQDPRQWHLLQSMLDWAWHIPAFEALLHRAISTFGLEDAYRLLAANVDIMSWSATSKEDADRIAESLPGYRLARTVFNTLSAANQDRLLCFALFSNAAPIDPEKLIGIMSQSKHHLQSPAQRAMRAVKTAWRKVSKPSRGGDAPCEEAGAETESVELLKFLATLGLVDHRDFYVAFEWDSDGGELSVSRAYARLHPSLSLFLFHGVLSRKLSRRRIQELAKGFLSYHGSRLSSLLAEETPLPLREAAAAGDESARALYQYNANKEVEWGLWNFSAAMETWKESISRGANDLTYAQLFYNFFMEPQPLQYQFLDDPLVIATAVDVVLLLAPVHDRRLREWYKCERQLSLRALRGNIPGEDDPEIYRTMVTLPRAYWAVFDLIFACTNWLCCSFRQREDHAEFNCWVKISALLLKAVEGLQGRRAEEMALYRDAQDQFARQDLPVQVEAAKRIVRLQLEWPNTGFEMEFSESGSIEGVPELAPLADFMRQVGAVIRRERMWGFPGVAGGQRALGVVNAQLGTIASAMAHDMPKLFSKLPAEILLKLRMQGWAPEDDGVPWPARDSAAGGGEDLDVKEIYNQAKREHLVTGEASSYSRALAKMRKKRCRWEDVREECEASFERWYKFEWPQILLNLASHGKHGRMMNKLQVQALMAKREWNGCLVYLDLVASGLEPPVDAAFWALCRATCLLELNRVDEAAEHAATAFELCTASSVIEMQSFFDLLHAMYRLLERWPVNRNGASTLPSQADILLVALKIGYHEYDSQQQIYAQNGTLFVLFLKLIDERLVDVSSVEDNNELLDVQESPSASDEDFQRRLASFAPRAAFSEEELREGPDSFAEIIFEAQLVQNVIGDLNRSLRWLESTILAHLSFGGSRFMKEGFVERVLHAKGIGFPVPKTSLDEDDKASDEETDESSLEFRYTSPSTEDASVDEESNRGSTPGGRVIPKEIDIHSSYATEVLELLLQTKWRQKKIGAKTIMDMAKRRWAMPLDWRREHYVLSDAFLNRYARLFLMDVKNSDAPQMSRGDLWKELEWDLMDYRLLGI